MLNYDEVRTKIIEDAKQKRFFTGLELKYIPRNTAISDKEVAKITAIEEACFIPGRSHASRMKQYLESNEILILKHKKTILACVLFSQDDKMIYINHVIVAPAYQKQGCRSRLLRILMKLADKMQRPIQLESSPCDQYYYSELFGFKVLRQKSQEVWQGIVPQGSFPIRKLKMQRKPYSQIVKFAKQHSVNPEAILTEKHAYAHSAEGQKLIRAVQNLAKYARISTSKWYRFFHSKEKESALLAIEQTLAIQLEPSISKKDRLTPIILKGIVRGILKDTMIVRGLKRDVATTSGQALYNLFATPTNHTTIKNEDILLIKQLLHFKQENYQSYAALRSKLFGKQDYNSTKADSPYIYYTDKNTHLSMQ